MIVAVALGAISGFAGFLPLAVSLEIARRDTSSRAVKQAVALLLGILFSVAILLASAGACVAIARDLAVSFGLAEGITLSVCAIGYGVYTFVRK